MNLLKNQVAIVTGSTAGIGKAIALKFAEEGAKVVVIGTNGERGAQVVAAIEKLNGEGSALFLQVNVAKTAEVEDAVKKVLEKFGQIDILVNNAGITRDQLLMRMSEEEWDEVMAINVKSCYNTCRSVVRSMMKARKGKIINLGSVVGLMGNAGQANYAASKAAVVGFTKGFIETAMTDAMTEAQKTATLASIPLGRMGSVQEIAEAALFLATAHYITGQVLTVDGGMVM
jgi:3-oxoacyl-[acyl-carrier protein] reductase